MYIKVKYPSISNEYREMILQFDFRKIMQYSKWWFRVQPSLIQFFPLQPIPPLFYTLTSIFQILISTLQPLSYNPIPVVLDSGGIRLQELDQRLQARVGKDGIMHGSYTEGQRLPTPIILTVITTFWPHSYIYSTLYTFICISISNTTTPNSQ